MQEALSSKGREGPLPKGSAGFYVYDGWLTVHEDLDRIEELFETLMRKIEETTAFYGPMTPVAALMRLSISKFQSTKACL